MADHGPRRPGRDGFSLMELMLVLTLMSILVSSVMPTFQRAVEQAKADIAVANLRAVWAAHRLYWLDNRTVGYAPDLTTLQGLDLIDGSLATGTVPYTYAVTAADAHTFTVTSTRTGSARWQGAFAVDQTGVITGVVTASGAANVVPASQ